MFPAAMLPAGHCVERAAALLGSIGHRRLQHRKIAA
jgi:hypothetical protein